MSLLGLNDAPEQETVNEFETVVYEPEYVEPAGSAETTEYADNTANLIAALSAENAELRRATAEAVNQTREALELTAYQTPPDVISELDALRAELWNDQLESIRLEIVAFRKSIKRSRSWWRRLFSR